MVKHTGYDINGFYYITWDWESNCVTQNSGIILVAEVIHATSAKDKNFVTCDMTLYGVIDEIWILNYHLLKNFMLRCDLVWNSGSVKNDEHKFILWT